MDNIEKKGPRDAERGSALVPTLVVVSALATIGLALLTTGLGGAKNITFESDEYRLTNAVESVATLASEDVWSGYLVWNGGASGTIGSFRTYLDSINLTNSQISGAPDAYQGADWTGNLGLPAGPAGAGFEYDQVVVDAVRLVRQDVSPSITNLYVTVAATTQRGAGLANPTLNRAIQVLYSIEPDDFTGFEFALLGNNVNCIFCHTRVDSVDRFFNGDPLLFSSFDRIKVGTLETLMIRHDMDGKSWKINDFDADSRIAGSLYVRGDVTDHDGMLINSGWGSLSLGSYQFDQLGKLFQDNFGGLQPTQLSPAGQPAQPMENLYLDYETDPAKMADGLMPDFFPPPFPDNGGASGTGAGNKLVDGGEFLAATAGFGGTITGGAITLVGSDAIDTPAEYQDALTPGSPGLAAQLASGHVGPVILTGTAQSPLVIDGSVAIDGDVVLSGYLQSSGAIYASGNVYIPGDLQYVDGTDSSGLRTFGVDAQGNLNGVAVAAGGNVLIGDYLRPSGLREDFTFGDPAKFEIIPGDSSGKWSFTLAEISIFNRNEWAKTQQSLPGPNQSVVPNPDYDATYVPRYYQFGPGDEIPIYNKGNLYFDSQTGTWLGDAEVPSKWDPNLLTIVDPANTSSTILYDANGNLKAAVLQMTSEAGWFDDDTYKALVETLEDTRTWGEPMHIDSLVYTNNAIMGIVNRATPYQGQMVVNGMLIAADIGMLVPSIPSGSTVGTSANLPGSPFKIGLQLNYDRRLKDHLNVKNPLHVTMKLALWNPTANLL